VRFTPVGQETSSSKQGIHVKSKWLWVAGALALPVAGTVCAQQAGHGHEHGARSPEVQAALDAAIAKVPPPAWSGLRETRRAGVGKSGEAGAIVELDAAVGISVVVVLDENGQPHTECVESAAPQIVAAAKEPR
jgi:hypothetical protein